MRTFHDQLRNCQVLYRAACSLRKPPVFVHSCRPQKDAKVRDGGSCNTTERNVWRDGGKQRGPSGRLAFRRLFYLGTCRAHTESGTALSVRPCNKQTNSVALVRERTIPTERPPPVGEVSANFCG